MTLQETISELEAIQRESFSASRSAMLRGDVSDSDLFMRRITALEHALVVVSQIGSGTESASAELVAERTGAIAQESNTSSALLSLRQEGEGQEHDHGGTSLTADDRVSVSLPAPELPHDARRD